MNRIDIIRNANEYACEDSSGTSHNILEKAFIAGAMSRQNEVDNLLDSIRMVMTQMNGMYVELLKKHPKI